MDRNFKVYLLDLQKPGDRNEIFESPDEGFPDGERIVWSNDSTRFLFLGKQFSVEVSAVIERSGERLYLLYDIPSKSLWCNASQTTEPRFDLNMLTNVVWAAF